MQKQVELVTQPCNDKNGCQEKYIKFLPFVHTIIGIYMLVDEGLSPLFLIICLPLSFAHGSLVYKIVIKDLLVSVFYYFLHRLRIQQTKSICEENLFLTVLAKDICVETRETDRNLFFSVVANDICEEKKTETDGILKFQC